MIQIILDCYGGDNSPLANVSGAVLALERLPELSLLLTGDAPQLEQALKGFSYDKSRVELVHAPDVVSCNDKPTDAIRLKKESSLIKAINLLRENDELGGMVSIGSTGSLVAGAMLRVGRLKGVLRPAFCPILPTMSGGTVAICDSGANVECDADYLQQFAVMGSLYLREVNGIKNPRVALLNVGVESEKGDELRKQTYALLRETPDLNFVGNMESRDLLTGKYDLVVCDGFSGNVLIKSTEGACLEVFKRLKKDIDSHIRNKLGGLLLRKTLMAEKQFMNYNNYGGSVLLGTKKVVVKGHGSSNAVGVAKCIEQAYRMDDAGLCEQIQDHLCALPSAKGGLLCTKP